MDSIDRRREVLRNAEAIIAGEDARAADYDGAEDSFEIIAQYWIIHLRTRFGVDIDLLPEDVAVMMDLFKTARLGQNMEHKDSWTDKVGYTGCGYGWAMGRVTIPDEVFADLDLLRRRADNPGDTGAPGRSH